MFVGIDFWSGFLLMLSGDVESNPGPVTPISNPNEDKITGRVVEDGDRFMTALARLETGQSTISDTLQQIMSRLDTFEVDLNKVKQDIKENNERQIVMGNDLISA